MYLKCRIQLLPAQMYYSIWKNVRLADAPPHLKNNTFNLKFTSNKEILSKGLSLRNQHLHCSLQTLLKEILMKLKPSDHQYQRTLGKLGCCLISTFSSSIIWFPTACNRSVHQSVYHKQNFSLFKSTFKAFPPFIRLSFCFLISSRKSLITSEIHGQYFAF